MIEQVNRLFKEGHYIILLTARGKSSGIDWTDLTKRQLKKFKCNYHELMPMFTKPNADIFVDDKSLKKQIMKIQTKSLSVDEVKNPNDCNVFKLYKIIASEDDVKNLSKRYTQGGLGYGEAKEILYSEIINKYAKNRKKFFELMDDKQVVEDLLIDGAKKARVQAQKVLKRVRANVGY